MSDFLAPSSSLKTVNTRKLAKSFLRIFRDALILVFVNENCCLCQCFTELHFFYWLLEVSSNFNRFAVCFQSFINIACGSTQNAERINQTLFKTTHRYKTITLPEIVDILRPWLIVSGISFSKWRTKTIVVRESVSPAIF